MCTPKCIAYFSPNIECPARVAVGCNVRLGVLCGVDGGVVSVRLVPRLTRPAGTTRSGESSELEPLPNGDALYSAQAKATASVSSCPRSRISQVARA